MAQRQVGLRLDPVLLDRLDRVRGDVPRNRWIERVLEGAVVAVEVGAADAAAPRVVGGRQTTVEEQIAGRSLEAERLERFAKRS